MAIVDEFRDTVIPVIVFFVILNVIGLIGNFLIIFIYSFRYKKNHFRRLVLCLSCVDMISCCTTVPMETASTWFWFDTPSRGLCKLKNFCVQFSATSAIYMLFVTAVYKYLRICRPFGKQVTNKNIVVLFFIGISVSLFLATPAAIIWDINEGDVEINKVNGSVRVCEVSKDYSDTAFPIVYRSVLSIYDLFVIATVVLYVFVAKAIILHIRGKTKKSKMDGTDKESSISTTEDIDRTESYGARIESERSSSDRNMDNRQSRRPSRRFRLSTTEIRRAVIMVVLAGMFSLTFLMGLSFGYVFVLRDYEDFASFEEIVQLFVCYKFYYSNYALNSIVYLILDRTFRTEVFKLLGLSGFACTNRCVYSRRSECN